MESSTQQHPTFGFSEKSFVEYKKFAFYFYSHIDNVNPIVLNKTAINKFLAAYAELDKRVSQEKLCIQQDLNINATLIEAGKQPFDPIDKEFYKETLTTYKVWKICLQANKYQNNIYVWLKLFAQSKEDPLLYVPCKGGVILPHDNFADLKKFITNCTNPQKWK